MIWLVGLAGLSLGSRRLMREERERALAEEALRREQALNARILDRLPIDIFLTDKERRPIFVNDSAARTLAMPRERMYGKTALDLFPPNIAEELYREDLQVLTTGEAVRREGQIFSQGEERHMLMVKMRIEPQDGKGPYLLGFAMDITERKRAEAQLLHDALHYRRARGVHHRQYRHRARHERSRPAGHPAARRRYRHVPG